MIAKNITAEFARKIATQSNKELEDILYKIFEEAKNKKFKLHIYNSSLSEFTIDGLKNNGFEVKTHGGIEFQMDQIYHTISWNKKTPNQKTTRQ